MSLTFDETYVVGTHWNRLASREAIPMRTHIICLIEEETFKPRKLIFLFLSSVNLYAADDTFLRKSYTSFWYFVFHLYHLIGAF